MPRGNPREKKKLTWGSHSPNKVAYYGNQEIPPEGYSIHARGRELFGKDHIKKRSRKQRCPKCKKLRMWWLHPNMEHKNRFNRVYKIDVNGKVLRVCHVCWQRSDEGQVEAVHKS